MTDDQVMERVGSDKNLLNKLGKGNRTNHNEAGRHRLEGNLTPFMREIIASAATLDTAKNVAQTFGVSEAHAHNLKNGYITRSNGKNQELLAKKKAVLTQIHDKAADLVLDALGLVTPEKLKTIEKVKDITAVAKDLATVIEKTTPDKKDNGPGMSVHIYSPGQVDLNHFETIDVEAMEIE